MPLNMRIIDIYVMNWMVMLGADTAALRPTNLLETWSSQPGKQGQSQCRRCRLEGTHAQSTPARPAPVQVYATQQRTERRTESHTERRRERHMETHRKRAQYMGRNSYACRFSLFRLVVDVAELLLVDLRVVCSPVQAVLIVVDYAAELTGARAAHLRPHCVPNGGAVCLCRED